MEHQRLKIGLPRAMLYYRYRILWRAFFQELGMDVVISGPTDREILEHGTALAIDEACLSLKIYLGHVAALVGQCDYILVPRVSNFGWHRNMCTRFESAPDLVRNVFRDSRQKFLTYEVDELEKKDERSAFLDMGRRLERSDKEIKRAYKRAKRTELTQYKARVRKQEQLYRQEGLKILIAGHSYIVEDPYVGKVVIDYLRNSGVVPLRADLVERDGVDGIILLSVFPCGPDAMVNEIITRRVKGVPMLNLVLDSQTGTAGVETRLESFIDIIRLKEGTL